MAKENLEDKSEKSGSKDSEVRKKYEGSAVLHLMEDVHEMRTNMGPEWYEKLEEAVQRAKLATNIANSRQRRADRAASVRYAHVKY